MSIYEQVIDVCEKNHKKIFSTSEIIDLVHKKFGSEDQSIIPTDYCYNRINLGIDFKKHIFVRVDRGKFKFVGENYPYSGKIYFKPKDASKSQIERVVGEWNNDIFYLWEKFPKVSIEHYKPELNPDSMLNEINPFKSSDITIPDDIQEINDSDISETEKDTLVLARIGQGQFRTKLIEYWGKCAVTGCTEKLMLRASHIKPWKVCNNAERLDPFNGLLLSPNYDIAFDQGLITFDKDGYIMVSKKLDNQNIQRLNIKVGTRVKFEKRHHSYFKYHRNNRFQK